MIQRYMLFIMFVSFVVIPAPSQQTAVQANGNPRYTVIDLGEWAPNAMNDVGVVVGENVRWSEGQQTLLFPASIIGNARDVNAAGQIAGYVESSDPLQFIIDAVYWVGDTMTMLPRLNGFAMANGLNASGVAVGQAGLNIADCNPEGGCTVSRAVRWDDNGIQILNLLTPTDCSSDAFDINDAGTVIGQVTVGILLGGDFFPDCYEMATEVHGVIWENGQPIDLGPGTFPLDINNNGIVVGVASEIDFDRAIRWVNGSPVTLGDLGFGGQAQAINDDGKIVGVVMTETGEQRAALWETNTAIDLNTLINDDSWVLTEARAINSIGQIAGIGVRDGQSRAFLLTPIPQVPLIVIPGITGSYLNKAAGGNVWPFAPPFLDLTLDPRQPQTDIVATDAIRFAIGGRNIPALYGALIESLKRAGYHEYRRSAKGCDRAQPATLFVFPYDWRRSNADNAARLHEYIECARQFSPTGQVDIVAHSMGGILSRRYILEHRGVVRKLVTIGTPWIGVPQALYVLETGQLRGGFNIFDFVLANLTALKTLVRYWPGVHELLPAPTYFNLGGRPFVESGWDIDRDGLDQSFPTTHPQFAAMLDRQYIPSTPGSNNATFYSLFGQTDWRSEPAGVRYYHIIGIQRGAQTIGRVVAAEFAQCSYADGKIRCVLTRGFRVFGTMGDGTVPVLSAARIGNNLNLNARGARLIPLIATARNSADVEHVALLSNKDAQAAVIAALLSRPTVSTFSQQQALATENELPPELPELPAESPAVTLRLQGISGLIVHDAFGNNTMPISDTFQPDLPGATIVGIGSPEPTAFLEAGSPYTATMTIDTLPGTLAVTVGTTTNTTRAVRWIDLSLPAGTHLQLLIAADGSPTLRADSDGDGSFEVVLPPSVSLLGADANDIEAPTITFSPLASSESSLIHITATDTGSGIHRLLVSLDGQTFEPYTTPVNIDSATYGNIIAIADDNAGNRRVARATAKDYYVRLPLVFRP